MRLPGPSRRRSTGAGLRRLVRHTQEVRWRTLGYLPAAVAVIRARRKVGLPQPVSLAVAATAPFAVARSLPKGRGRAVAVWLAHMWAYKACFEVPYDKPERLRSRLHIDPTIRADTVIGLGVPPGQRLQSRLRRPPILSALDKAMTAVYLLWELEPHAVLGWILWRHPRRFPISALRLAATYDATLLGYFLMPTAPPWWASEEAGRMRGEVRRVTLEVMRGWQGKSRPARDHNTGANPWASMPSDHFATAVSTAFNLAEVDPWAGALGWTYALALGTSLVYTGEHYVIDLLAGLSLALAVRGAETLLPEATFAALTGAVARLA